MTGIALSCIGWTVPLGSVVRIANSRRLQAWIALQDLVPTIEKHLKDGTWPAPQQPDLPLPTFTPRQITFNCNKG